MVYYYILAACGPTHRAQGLTNSFKGPEKEEDPAPTFPAPTVENTLLLIQDQTIKFLASHTLASPDQVKERNVFIEDINTIIRIGLAGRNPKINYDE